MELDNHYNGDNITQSNTTIDAPAITSNDNSSNKRKSPDLDPDSKKYKMSDGTVRKHEEPFPFLDFTPLFIQSIFLRILIEVDQVAFVRLRQTSKEIKEYCDHSYNLNMISLNGGKFTFQQAEYLQRIANLRYYNKANGGYNTPCVIAANCILGHMYMDCDMLYLAYEHLKYYFRRCNEPKLWARKNICVLFTTSFRHLHEETIYIGYVHINECTHFRIAVNKIIYTEADTDDLQMVTDVNIIDISADHLRGLTKLINEKYGMTYNPDDCSIVLTGCVSKRFTSSNEFSLQWGGTPFNVHKVLESSVKPSYSIYCDDDEPTNSVASYDSSHDSDSDDADDNADDNADNDDHADNNDDIDVDTDELDLNDIDDINDTNDHILIGDLSATSTNVVSATTMAINNTTNITNTAVINNTANNIMYDYNI